MARRKIPTAPALVLFDIDGTLIRGAGPLHRNALVEAVRQVTGLESGNDHIPVQGMLDREILRIMLRQAGASATAIRRAMPAIVERAQEIYVRACPNLKDNVCPGVRRLLGALDRRQIAIGLVTGNLSAIGWKKMQRAGLRRFFRFGVFSEQAHNRKALVRLAVRRAIREGWIDRSGRVTLVGDHPNDILAARANHVRAVAVATGLAGREELAAHAPELLLDDLSMVAVERLLGP